MTEHTPTTDEVRADFCRGRWAELVQTLNRGDGDHALLRSEFDRWLAQVKADAFGFDVLWPRAGS